MAPSSFKKLGAVVACATAVKAATESYQLAEEYTADNFFDKFDFFTSTYTSGDSWDATHGFVQYRDQADAERLGLISTSNGQVYIGPDTNGTYDAAGTGRNSVRITSKATYNEGLMVAKFSHMPAQACGAWPAFWSYGSPWLTLGEIDYFEGWNEMGFNRMAMHTNKTLAGECSLTTTGIAGTVMTDDCNNGEDMTGCGVQDHSGVWSSTTGGTFAAEWTASSIKIWSWIPSAVPADITNGTPDPTSSAWGNPTLLLEQTNCDLAKSFANHQLVFNIDFCGDTAGSPTFWNETCSAKVGDSCANYVANNPAAFAETYFMVEGIQHYELGVAAASASVIPSTSTSASAGLLAGTGSVLETTLGATITPTTEAAAVETAVPSHHTTSYIYGTSTSTDDLGSETTVVVVVGTTICPITAAEASESSLSASGSSVAAVQTTPASQPAAVTSDSPVSSPTPHTTLTRESTLTSVQLTTSTIFSTSSSTITSCASTASQCSVGHVTTVVIAVSTTICPVTATEASTSQGASSVAATRSTGVPVPVSSTKATSENSPVQATGSAGPAPSSATSIVPSPSTGVSRPASSGKSASDNSPVKATGSASPSSSSRPGVSGKSTRTAAAATASATASASSRTGNVSATSPTTQVVSMTDTGGGLELATDAPSSVSLEWLTAATAAATAAPNGTVTSDSSAASETSTCAGLDCIVVSSGGSKTDVLGASGLALVVLAGAMFLF